MLLWLRNSADGDLVECRISSMQPLGISAEEFLNDFRTPEQLAALDKARRCRFRAQHIGGGAPKPPLKLLGDSTPGRDKLFLPRGRPRQTVNPVSHWIRR